MLLTKAREAKEALTLHASARVTAQLDNGEVIEATLTSEIFTDITRTLVQKTLAPTRKALRDAALQVSDVKGVVMVGGSTRMPQIQQAVGAFFGCEPLNNLDPDKVVALGAAMQADVLAGNKAAGDDWLLLDVIPLSLGIETMGELVERIVPRNSTLPVARAQEFTTFKDGQTAMRFHVVQGERERVGDCRSLAHFELRGIPPMVAGAARIRVMFQVDADGLLSVTAREISTGVEAAVSVKPAFGLADEDISRMLRDSFEHAKEDMHLRALNEARVDAQRLIEAVHSALEADHELLESEERAAIDCRIEELQSAMKREDHRAVKTATDALNRVTDTFAARRMDRQVAQVLKGRRVNELDF